MLTYKLFTLTKMIHILKTGQTDEYLLVDYINVIIQLSLSLVFL